MTGDAILYAGDEAAMVALGESLGRELHPGLVVFLEGDLGLGKTTLCRGVLRAYGHCGAVKSPTYTLVEPYQIGPLFLYHFDLYRLGHPEELEFMGIRDYFGEDSVCLIEWPERGFGFLPPADIRITIVREGSGRRLSFSASTPEGVAVVSALKGVH